MLSKENELFIQLRLYFSFMKESYLTINNVDDTSFDIVKMILDQNYNILGDKYKHEMLEKLAVEK